MSINKLSEFAVNGDKSISGLTLTTGFPRQQKPYRQWMNYLFNMVTAKTNQLVDAVNALDVKIEPLLKPIAIGEGFFTVTDYQSASEVAAAKGYGTWQRFAEGKTLVGYSAQSGELDEYRIMGNEFGANTHTLSKNEMPKHKHAYSASHEGGSNADNDSTGWFSTNNSAPIVKHSESNTDGSQTNASGGGNALYSEGGNQPHNNIQPSIVVAYWLRVG